VRVYTPAELRRFLAAMDAALERRAEVVVIGGAAAAVVYGVARGTRDIDTWTRVGEDLALAAESARQATGLAVPVARAGVADGPHEFESRLERALPRLRRLRVRVPEKHDLVLMKVLRGDEHDLEAIEAIHGRSPLDLSTLVKRYRDEMGATIVDPGRLRGQFLTMVERLFPDDVESVERRLSARGR
jgi:Nucleotidyltransferase of unknown function (DUF6036)